MADQWDKYIVEDNKKDDWEQYAVSSSSISPPVSPTPVIDKVIGTGAGLLSGGLGAYGLYQIGKGIKNYLQAPQKQIAPILEQFKIWQGQNPSLQNIQSQDLPKFINYKTSIMESKYGNISKNIQFQANKGQLILQQRLQDFDNSILSSNIENLSNTVKTNYPRFLQDTYQAYKMGLEGYESILSQKKIQLSTLEFDTQVVNKTLENLRNSIPEENLTALKPILRDATQSERPITLSQAKKHFEQIRNNLPPEGQYKITENWGKFLEKNATPEVAKQLGEMNKNYITFAEARTTLNKYLNPKTGEFDIKGLNNYFLNYAKKKIDSGTKNLMEFLGEGSELTKPIEGIKEKFKGLESLKSKRAKIVSAESRVSLSKQQRLPHITVPSGILLSNNVRLVKSFQLKSVSQL